MLPMIALLAASNPVLLHDTDILHDETLVPRTPATVYVEVRGASSLLESEPIPGATVRLFLAKRQLVEAITDDAGRARLSFEVPDIEPGSSELVIETKSQHGVDSVRRMVRVEQRLLL